MSDTSAPTLEAQIRALEERLLDPVVRASPHQVGRLLADDFVEFGASGRVWERAAVIAALRDDPGEGFRLTDFRLRPLGSGVVLASYRVRPLRSAGAAARVSLRSSVWVLREGRWQLAFHQGTPMGETG